MNELRTMFGELMARFDAAELREKYNWAVELARDITSELILLQCRKFENATINFTRRAPVAGPRALELVGRSVQDKRVILDLEQMTADAYQSIVRDFQGEANFERIVVEFSEQINIARDKLARTVPSIYAKPAEFWPRCRSSIKLIRLC